MNKDVCMRVLHAKEILGIVKLCKKFIKASFVLY